MRLNDYEIDTIKKCIREVLGEDAKVVLFGSRVFDGKKGGDIDLLVEIPAKVDDIVKKKLQVLSRIQRAIGDQKIDLIITHFQEFSEDNTPLIIKNARKDGILL